VCRLCDHNVILLTNHVTSPLPLIEWFNCVKLGRKLLHNYSCFAHFKCQVCVSHIKWHVSVGIKVAFVNFGHPYGHNSCCVAWCERQSMKWQVVICKSIAWNVVLIFACFTLRTHTQQYKIISELLWCKSLKLECVNCECMFWCFAVVVSWSVLCNDAWFPLIRTAMQEWTEVFCKN